MDRESPEKLKDMKSTLELFFNHGKYQYLGGNIAMELNKVFVEAGMSSVVVRDSALMRSM